MRTTAPKISGLRGLLPLFFILVSCGPQHDVANKHSKVPEKAVQRLSVLESPARGLELAVNEAVPVVLSWPDSLRVDSAQLFLGGVKQLVLEPSGDEHALSASLNTEGAALGRISMRVKLFFSNGNSENHSCSLTLLSDRAPLNYGYELVRSFPHDAAAYTQGLQYLNGMLYEGTGNYGSSSLRLVDLESGEARKLRDLDPSLFGEGICVLGEHIYQLTYKSQVCFIYDKNSFEEIRKVYYKNKEGWGLCHNGEELIMSDGSNVLYFLDPQMFTINRQIEVYDDKGRADKLNELEYIDGKIWANRYYTDEIVIIDPESGRLEGRVNLKGILKASDRKPGTDVLNGIAWDEAGGRIFVTGKYWPKLFEIRIKEKGGSG
ncbi:MAG: glutamine cyclotransferase [Bacteroidetes bacterium]|nr:MAG: glutamine cyclotransferase [Bacteroidota bacterium]